MKQVILDVETKRTFDEVGGGFPDRLGVSFVGVCLRESLSGQGQLLRYFEKDLPDLFELLTRADVIIGFNIDEFDLPTLDPYTKIDTNQLPTLDLLTRIRDSAGHRIGLDAVAQATLGVGKTGHGLDAIKYYRNQEWEKLAQYCLQDVAVTRDVYDYGLKQGLVKFKNKWNRLVECSVDFSYEPPKNNGVQMSLL